MSELKGHENSYWIADRSFELPELKILMDAVQAAIFIPEDKTEQLVSKIAALGGSHKAELLQGNIIRFNTRKHTNHSIFYNIQAIEEAMVPVKSETRKKIHEYVKSLYKSITFSALFHVQYIVFLLHSSQNSSQNSLDWNAEKTFDWNRFFTKNRRTFYEYPIL